MAQRATRTSPRARRALRGLVVGGGAAVVLLAAVLALAPVFTPRPAPPAGPNGASLVISMAGFTPNRVTVRAGQPVTLTLTNPDSQFHTDGGGWHQFAIDALRLDVRIAPRSTERVTLAALAPGTYEFYCDICCGGRANPSMLGVLEVQG